ncbi:MAG: hypothetical protein QOI20_3288 [Acidimicrobiaceae bacterium]|jgi:hypothetical protein|nr:hypothetical protein [Acidimicrobiaceae bacterium]
MPGTGADLASAVYPDPGLRRRRAHLYPSSFAPRLVGAAAPTAAARALYPDPGLAKRRAHLRPTFFAPATIIADAVVSPSTPAGVGVLAMSVQDEATVTFSWLTDLKKGWSGKEQRIAILTAPRQRLQFTAQLSDALQRTMLSQLAAFTVSGSQFQLALPYEDVAIVSVVGKTVTTSSLAYSDWAVLGQRVAVVAPDGAIGAATIQSVVGSAIALDVDLSATVARPGARIMPLVLVYLEPQQRLSRYAANLGEWELVARVASLRFGASTAVGVGAAVTTYASPDPTTGLVTVMPVWDRGNALEVAEQPLYSGAELQDLGARVGELGRYAAVDWERHIRIESSARSDWQWFKRFLDTIRGQQVTFLLPTGRPDLAPLANVGVTLTVAGTDYYTAWLGSLAHRRIRATLPDGSIAYRTIVDAAPQSGNTDIELGIALPSRPTRVEFLETVRLASDDVEVTWRANTFEAELVARVVQQ